MARSEKSQQRALAATRKKQALELRQAGATFEAIGETLGITRSGAFKAVGAALETIKEETKAAAGDYLALELVRLDRLYQAAYRSGIAGDLNATDRCLRITDLRARLLGLYAKVKVSLDVDVTNLTDEELQQLAEGKFNAGE